MWFDTKKGVLYSSGDDGWLLGWNPSGWDAKSAPSPVWEFDLNQWVLSELKGTIVKMDDKELVSAARRASPTLPFGLLRALNC